MVAEMEKSGAETVATEGCLLRILPQLKSFLGCCTLRTGTQIIGWFYAVLSVIAAVLISGSLLCLPFVITDPKTKDEVKGMYLNVAIIGAVALVIILVVAVTSIRLLVGVHQRRAGLLKPFIVMFYVYLVASIVMQLLEYETGFINNHVQEYMPEHPVHMTHPITFIFRVLIGAYILMVVNSHHRELKDQSFGYKPQV